MSALTAAIIAGDPDAWAIIDAHASRLGSYAAGRGLDPADALQEMRIKIWRAAAKGKAVFESSGHLVQYGAATMRSVTYDAHRSRQSPTKKHTPVLIDAADRSGTASPDSADIADHTEWRQRFWDVLAPHLIGPRERIAIGTLAVAHANTTGSAFGTGAFHARQVAAQWPHLFANERDVYDTRRKTMGRIRRNLDTMNALRKLREEAA